MARKPRAAARRRMDCRGLSVARGGAAACPGGMLAQASRGPARAAYRRRGVPPAPQQPRPSTFRQQKGPRTANRGPWYTDMVRSCARRGSVGARGSMLHQQRFSRSLSCRRAWASRKPSASCCSLIVYRRCRSWVLRYSSRAAAMTGASLAVMLMRIYGITSPPGGLYIVARLAARGPIERRPGSNKAQPRRPCVSG